MKSSKSLRTGPFCFCCLVLFLVVTALLVPGQAGAQTFSDDFDNTTTYLLPVNPNTKWRQVNADFGIITSDIGSDGTGFSARLIDEHPGWGWPALAADNAQQFDLSSIMLGAEIKPNSTDGGGGIGFGVYDDSGENLAAGIAAGLSFDDVFGLAFMLFSMNAYEESPTVLDAIPVTIDTGIFHTMTMEMLDGVVSAELDGIWQISGTPHINIDVAGTGLWADDLSDFSFDNFSMTGQPDNRRVVFQDVEILEDTVADELYPSWSANGKMIAYTRDELDTGPWNIWVKQIDPPAPAVQCTQNEDDVYIFSTPAFSPDYSHILFIALTPEGRFEIKRARTDGIGDAETILSESGISWLISDLNSSCELMLGQKISHTTGQNWIFSMGVTADGLPIAGTEKILVDFPPTLPAATGGRFDAACERLAFMSTSYPPSGLMDSDLYVLNGVQEILNDITAPPIDYTDLRLEPIATGPNFQATARFSRDGSLVYYSEDVHGTYDFNYMKANPHLPTEEMFGTSHWEIFAVDPEPPHERIKLNYYRPYNQGALATSPDGTKLVFVSGNRSDSDGVVDADLYIVTLKVQEAIDASAGGQIVDGSGTTLDIPADSISEDTVVSVKTPLPGDMPSPDTLPWGLQNIALARVVDAESETATVDPDNPPTLTIHYTDEEIAGLDELSLRIYVYNEDTLSWEALGRIPCGLLCRISLHSALAGRLRVRSRLWVLSSRL
jgi:hypothetical protein